MSLGNNTVTQRVRLNWLLLLTYCGVLAVLLPLLPLWLDEILDLKGVRDLSFHELIRFIPTNYGGVPLGYLAQFITVHLFGFSSFSGRLPSALFSIAAAVGIHQLVYRYGKSTATLAATTFCLFPLQLRYAVEARPYSQALSLTIWSTVLFLALERQPRWLTWTGYCLLITAALYTQPYSLFVPAAHLAWILLTPQIPQRRKLLIMVSAAIVISVAAFLPWYLFAASAWRDSVRDYNFTFTGRSLLMIARELLGAGYIGTALAFLFCIFTFRHLNNSEKPSSRLLVIWMTLCVAGALIADAVFGYFIAIRQMIFVLAPLAILGALSISKTFLKTSWWLRAASILFAAVLVIADIQYFRRPHEDWRAASVALHSITENKGSCIVFLPDSSSEFYLFFDRELSGHNCAATEMAHAQTVALAVSPYLDAPLREQAQSQLTATGYALGSSRTFGGPRVYVYQRRLSAPGSAGKR
jgi:uncharacterized membrane protein